MENDDTGEERTLLRRAKAGDIGAFEDLVRLHQNRVYNTVLRHVRDEGMAADITQEVFIQAFRIIAEYDDRARFSTWLYRVAMNTLVSQHRYLTAQKRGGAKPTATLDADTAPDPAHDARRLNPGTRSPDEILEAREARERVLDAVNALEMESRQVVVLREIEGLSYDEIAKVLGVNEGTVRSRLFRARERLRVMLQDLVD